MKEDIIRKTIELALQAGRREQKSDSGFVTKNAGVPVVDNVYFILALFRSKTHEAMQEAKLLFDRILYFQQTFDHLPGRGNFPVYLHDYPYCRDHYNAAKIAVPFKMILDEFGTILGEQLRKRVVDALSLLNHFAKNFMSQEELPLWMQMKTLAATGELAAHSLMHSGKSSMKKQDYDPEAIGHMLASCYLVRQSLEGSWLYDFVYQTVHFPTKTYVGPSFRHLQSGFYPKCTLYDYMMGMLTGGLSDRALKAGSLQAALVVSSADVISERNIHQLDGQVDDLVWHTRQEPDFAVSWIEECLPITQPGFYPFFLWYDNRAITVQFSKGLLFCTTNKKQIVCEITFSPECFVGSTERKKVFALQIPDFDAQFLIEGNPATTFKMQETIEIKSAGKSFRVKMEQISGDVQFFGNIGPTNRPENVVQFGQLPIEGAGQSVCYDREIALRHLSGGQSKIRLQIDL